MSKVKAVVCTVLLLVVILALLFVTIFIEGAHGVNLFSCIMSMMAGFYMADKMADFYNWLRKKSK